MPSVTLWCTKCPARARRRLVNEAACRGVHEAPCEPAECPGGHGPMIREDGGRVASAPFFPEAGRPRSLGRVNLQNIPVRTALGREIRRGFRVRGARKP